MPTAAAIIAKAIQKSSMYNLTVLDNSRPAEGK